MGLPYPPVRERLTALEDLLQIIPRLLRGETVSHAGPYFALEEAKLLQLPVQQPRVPLLVAGGGERVSLRLVAQFADASNMGSFVSIIRAAASRTAIIQRPSITRIEGELTEEVHGLPRNR